MAGKDTVTVRKKLAVGCVYLVYILGKALDRKGVCKVFQNVLFVCLITDNNLRA